MEQLEECFVALWCLLMPLTSFVIIPSVQGTVPAYLMGFASIGFVLLRIRYGAVSRPILGYFKILTYSALMWIIFLVGSQIGNILHPQLDLKSIPTISDYGSLLFRPSLFTQSLYLVACIMIALYFRFFFRESWMRYVIWGAYFVTIYGLYDWGFYLVFQHSGDFLATRTFADGDHPGSWSQTINVGGLNLLRLKSMEGEPSYYSAVVIPFLFLALERKEKFLTLLLLVTAILSTSTAVYLGLVISVFIQMLWTKKRRGTAVAIFIILMICFTIFALYFQDTYRTLFSDKFSGDNDSGSGRLKTMEKFEDLLLTFSPLNWMFGVGFGYAYFTVPWAQIVNMGLPGLLFLIYLFLKPGYLLPREEGSEWLKISMISILVLFALTLSELFMPTTWMFLGLAYRKLDEATWAREKIYFKTRLPKPARENATPMIRPARQGLE